MLTGGATKNATPFRNALTRGERVLTQRPSRSTQKDKYSIPQKYIEMLYSANEAKLITEYNSRLEKKRALVSAPSRVLPGKGGEGSSQCFFG